MFVCAGTTFGFGSAVAHQLSMICWIMSLWLTTNSFTGTDLTLVPAGMVLGSGMAVGHQLSTSFKTFFSC
jgi:hypothetical protein